MKLVRRHIAKTFSWRILATIDTLLIAYIISGDFYAGFKIVIIEVLTKMFLYYLHERIWFNSKVKSASRRHFLKTFTWRFVGSIDTLIISGIVLENFLAGGKISLIEIVTKMILYFIHEKLWYKSSYGLVTRQI